MRHMKKYYTKSSPITGIVALLFLILLIIGIILTVFRLSTLSVSIFLCGFCGYMSILFCSLFFADRSRYLVVDEEKIDLPRGVMAILDEKKTKLQMKRTKLLFSDIETVHVEFYKADNIMAKSTKFYVFSMKNGQKYRAVLYEYGTEHMREILNMMRKNGIEIILT